MLREQIRATPEYRELTAAKQAAQPTQHRRETVTVGDALSPVLNWEKGDVEFWLQVAQLVVLILILRELQGAS